MEITTRILCRNATNSALGGISMAGFLANNRGLPGPKLRVFGRYALVYLIDGGGRYVDANGLERNVVPGDLILVFPDLGHLYGPRDGQNWTELYIVFDGPVFRLWEANGLLDQSQPIHHVEPIEYWVRRFESVLGAPRQTGFAPPLLEVCRLQMVLGEALVGGPRGPGSQADAQWVSRACALLESDLSPHVDLAKLARQLGGSYESFRKQFTRLVGMPPARYRAARIIDRACELMQQSTLSDKQVAQRLGFCDEFHFSRRFKQLVGISPREFRRRLPYAK